jgi:hypothetical protein
MARRTTLGAAGAGILLVGALVGGPATAAFAQTTPVCDAYSGSCTTAPPTSPAAGVDDTTAGTGNTGKAGTGAKNAGVADDAAQLPFTGGELVLVSTLGLAALGGGTVLVLAGRRRRLAGPGSTGSAA